MEIAVIGTGYVGLVTGVCFAELGNQVTCIDNDAKKIKALKKMVVPIYEPGIEELVRRNFKEKRLKFTTAIKEGIKNSSVVFIAVGTPSHPDGEADLTYVENVAREIARHLNGYKLIVEKSTVPVETGKWIERTIRIYKKNKAQFDVASNPEFLREGSAVSDFMHPDRVVIGVESKRSEQLLRELYRPLKVPLVVTDINSAELIKHASNSFLATKISFINAVSQVCQRVGADISKVAEGMGLDKRIGRRFLDAGIGYGGSCFPKDVDAFIHLSDKSGYDFALLKEVRRINDAQKDFLVKLIKKEMWILKDKTIGIWGLAFKPGTDDMRNAPSVEIIKALQQEGARIRAFDPQAMAKARECIRGIIFCKDAYDAAKGSDCLVVITEWNEFKEIDLKRIKKSLRQPLIFDGRNIYDPSQMARQGFRYYCIGRK